MKQKNLFAPAALLLLSVCQLFAAEIVVSPKGKDSNKGTESSPFRTVARAFKAAKPGDTVKLAPGSFFEQVVLQKSGKSGAPITIAGTRGPNGEYLTVMQAPGQILKNWQPAPEIGPNVWKVPLKQRPDLVMCDGAMIAYINRLTMQLPRKHKVPAVVRDADIMSKFGPKCRRIPGLDLLTLADDAKFTHQYMGYKKEPFWDILGNMLSGWHDGYLYLRLANKEDIRKHTFIATCGEGIKIENASHLVIRDLSLRSSVIQVRVTGRSSYNKIENCSLMHGGYRVRIDKTASHTTVQNCLMASGFIRSDLFMLRSSKDMRGGALYEIFKYIIGTSLSADVGVGNYGKSSKIIDNIIIQGLIGIRAFGPDVTVTGNVIHGMSSVGIVTGFNTSGRFYRNLVMNCGIPLRIHDYCHSQAKREEYHYNNLFVQDRHEGQQTMVHCNAKNGDVYKGKTKRIPKLSDTEKTYIYHNTFWGGRDQTAAFNVNRYARTFKRVMPFFVVNNIFKDSPRFLTHSHELAGPNLLYKFNNLAFTEKRRDPKVLELNKVLSIQDSGKIWNKKALPGLPDLTLAPDSPALGAGVDVSKTFTVRGKTYPALPGFAKGYFKGKAPAAGALQQGEDMRFFTTRYQKALDAMQVLSRSGIRMPVIKK